MATRVLLARVVEYPTQEEVELALRGMLKDRPHDLPDLSKAARSLAGRPMSDGAWVGERGRSADRTGQA
jgi:hypothetical protein